MRGTHYHTHVLSESTAALRKALVHEDGLCGSPDTSRTPLVMLADA